MLKIIDEYDLKGLEKFGFVKNGNYYDLEIDSEKNSNNTWIYISINNRAIYSEPDFEFDISVQEIIFDKLFELITSGIVEKVEE